MTNTQPSAYSFRRKAVFSILYLSAYALLLLNTSAYLDDHVTTAFQTGFPDLLRAYKELGFFLHWPAYVHGAFFHFGDKAGITLERLAIFGSYLLSAVFLNGTLRSVKEITASERFFTVLLFSLLPVNTSRIAISNFNYALSHLMFFGGLRLLAAYCAAPGIFARAGALLLFFFSFSTSSCLVFYLVGAAYLYYARGRGGSLRDFFVKHPDFLFLPVVFWLLKGLFFQAGGVYAGYNKITPYGILLSPVGTMSALFYLSELLKDALYLLGPLGILVVTVFSSYAGNLLFAEQNEPRGPAPRTFALAGLILLLLAVFPYAAVFKVPGAGWEDRHALLMPLGAALLVVYGVKECFKLFAVTATPARMSAVYFFFAAAFACSNAGVFYRFMLQDYKQQSLVENFLTSAIVRDNSTFLIRDDARDFNGMPGENFRPYEYSSLFFQAFGDQKRIAYDAGTQENYVTAYRELGIFANRAASYKIAQYVQAGPQYEITVRKGPYPLNALSMIKLRLLALLRPEKFRVNLKNLLLLDYRRLP